LFVGGSLKLIDFGIAKAIPSDDTVNIYRDKISGTYNYMSPESIVGSGSDFLAQKKCGRVRDSALRLGM
jgi:serine/threonine protein kinase